MAEREGFEPSERLHARRFSRPVHSTTLPPLQIFEKRRQSLSCATPRVNANNLHQILFNYIFYFPNNYQEFLSSFLCHILMAIRHIASKKRKSCAIKGACQKEVPIRRWSDRELRSVTMNGNALVSELRNKPDFTNQENNTQHSWLSFSGLITTSVLVIGSLALASCSGSPDKKVASASLERSQPIYSQSSERSFSFFGKKPKKKYASVIPLGGGVRKVGNPYKILGRWYTPKHQPNYNKVGVASWYGPGFHGKKTANGEIFDMNNLTAAHPTLPIPSYARVTNLANNRSLVLRINDRGPYAHDRILDLSKKSAKLLGVANKGIMRVRVQYIGPAPLSGDLSREHAHLKRQPWYKNGNTRQSWGSRSALGATTLISK